MSGRRAFVSTLLFALAVDCKTPEARGGGPAPEPANTTTTAATTTAPSVSERDPPLLTAVQPITTLPINGHNAAVLSLPLGATSKKPILVATHGRDDVPEPLCEMWRGVVADRAFVVCPRGVPSQTRPGAYTYANYQALSREIEAAVDALRAKYPEHVDDGSLVYAGFSLGSHQGVRVVTSDPDKTPRVILIEGGHDPWNEELIETFADGGGQRVLFVTGQAINQQRSVRVAKELEEAGIASRVVHAEGAGHVYTGEVRERIAEAFDWVVEGDDRWKK
jgi:pimeloyl-ACP methyl ester carboxylesterase